MSSAPEPDGRDPRVSVVMITWNRREEALAALDRLAGLPERPEVIVVDNGSTDGTADAITRQRPGVRLIASPANLGAVGRNLGVDAATTPYVAFCDDDTWWDPGSLRAGADALDAHPRLGVVTARIVVEPDGEDDPIVAELENSPVRGPDWLPGPALGSFLAGASIVRAEAYREVGGFHERLWLGGEEELLAAALAAAGWELCYLPEMTVHHQASVLRDPHLRRRHGIRNTLWFTWLRRPLPAALRRTRDVLAGAPRDRVTAAGVLDALRGAAWVARDRRVLPPHVEARFLALEESQKFSAARRYES